MAKPTIEKPNKPNKKALSPKMQGVADTALAVSAKVNGALLTFDKAITKSKALIADGLQQLTAVVAMRGLTDIQVRDVFDYSAGVEDAISEAKKLARARVLDLAIRNGEHTGTTGDSRRLVFPDGRYLLAKATRTGIDPKKFEAALRAKEQEVTKYMVPQVSYKLPSDFNGPQQAVDDGVFTKEELETLAYEPTYAVERSKEGKGE